MIPGKDDRSYRLEYAVRSYITNRMGEMFNAVNQMNYEAIGADGWEISAHPAPAPDHAPYQGKQYTKEEYDRINNGLMSASDKKKLDGMPSTGIYGEEF